MKMNINVDFLENEMTFSFVQIKELMDGIHDQAYKEGLKNGAKIERQKIINMEKAKEANVSKPVIRPSTPENNKELLEKFFKPNTESIAITKKAFEDGYRQGHQAGYDLGLKGEKPKLNPILHVDNSVYGYIHPEDIKALNDSGESIVEISRKPDKGDTFVKITPIALPEVPNGLV
jgi:hypothetical protein